MTHQRPASFVRCSVAGCKALYHHAKGMCKKHYINSRRKRKRQPTISSDKK